MGRDEVTSQLVMPVETGGPLTGILDSRCWAGLHTDVLQLIANLLCPRTLLAARSTCRPWRANLTRCLTRCTASELLEVNIQPHLSSFQARVTALAAIFPALREYLLYMGTRVSPADVDEQLRCMAAVLRPERLELRHLSPPRPTLGAEAPQLSPALAAFAADLQVLCVAMGRPTEPDVMTQALLPLTRLTELRLNSGSAHGMTGRHLQIVAQLSSLHVLELDTVDTSEPLHLDSEDFDDGDSHEGDEEDASGGLTDLIAGPAGLPHLTSLHLHGLLAAVPPVLLALSHLPALRELRLQLHPTDVVGGIAALLPSLPPSCGRLFISSCGASSRNSLDKLSRVLDCPRSGSLAGLSLKGFYVKSLSKHLNQLACLTGLEELHVSVHSSYPCQPDQDLRLLRSLTRLRSLCIGQERYCRNFRHVPLLYPAPGVDVFDVLAPALANLTCLMLLNAGLTNATATSAGRCTKLRTLMLCQDPGFRLPAPAFRTAAESRSEVAAAAAAAGSAAAVSTSPSRRHPLEWDLSVLPASLTQLSLTGAMLNVLPPALQPAAAPARATLVVLPPALQPAAAPAGGVEAGSLPEAAGRGDQPGVYSVGGGRDSAGGTGSSAAAATAAATVARPLLKDLEDLTLQDCAISDACLRHLLARLGTLRSLELCHVEGLADDNAAALCALTALTALRIEARGCWYDAMRCSLDIDDRLSLAGVVHLTALRSLRQLEWAVVSRLGIVPRPSQATAHAQAAAAAAAAAAATAAAADASDAFAAGAAAAAAAAAHDASLGTSSAGRTASAAAAVAAASPPQPSAGLQRQDGGDAAVAPLLAPLADAMHGLFLLDLKPLMSEAPVPTCEFVERHLPLCDLSLP